MTSKKILIAFGTRYGTTEEIAKKIAEILETQELKTTVVDLKNTKSKNWPSLSEFDGIIVGSGIKIGRWMKEPQKFLKENQEYLKQTEKPLGVFISCALCLTDKEKAINDYLQMVLANLGVQANLMIVFGPLIDFSETSKMGWMAKKMFKAAAIQDLRSAGYTINDNARNDLRDWNAIAEFTHDFARLLQN
ncbi:MAG: hypothetical protein EU536_04135 [Promethearchaeota archaeon]|nr:MAG: hypothetical protein EU536_04135 [Candidatus Lokiarchaeota archaeon]